MPFKRKSFRRYRKSRKLPKRGRALALAKRNAIRLGRMSRSLRPEYKYKLFQFDSSTGNAVSIQGYYLNFAGPVQGTDSDQRVGDKIVVKGIWIQGQIQRQETPGGITDPDPIVRLCFAVWRSDIEPEYQDFFEPAALDNSAQATNQCWNQHRKGILKPKRDKRFTIRQGDSTTVKFKWFIRLNQPIKFNTDDASEPTCYMGLTYVASIAYLTPAQNPVIRGAVKYIYTDV